MNKAQQNLRLQQYITVGSVFLLLAKLAAYWLTHSLAILTDALESIVNVIAGFVGLYSLYVAAKPRDRDHPYGHGKAEFVSAAVEGTLIVAAGILIIYATINDFITPRTIHQVDTGCWIIAGTALMNYFGGMLCLRQGKKNNSLALQASGHHLQMDSYSTLAVLGGLLIMLFTKLWWIDKIIALMMSVLIMYNGYTIIRKSLAGIMDEADKQLLERFIQLLNKSRKKEWIDLHNLRVIQYGDQLHIDCHLTLPWYMNLHEAHREIDALSVLIQSKMGNSIELFVHTDGCMPFSCTVCSIENCQVRQEPMKNRQEWNLDNILSNEKHRL
ncbi:MAG: cation transporter [Chitinophagaceae bacterium]|nr:cation transporter [Chitinophagaceae bacterium]MCA6469412.1 cation transporter [Chitinophagaceae bacterium]MCA6493867.1 cation transporter [Chitinophagaceae bacterium]MCA6499657.1 cation transporter [Chitinophagaceae bacterium]